MRSDKASSGEYTDVVSRQQPPDFLTLRQIVDVHAVAHVEEFDPHGLTRGVIVDPPLRTQILPVCVGALPKGDVDCIRFSVML